MTHPETETEASRARSFHLDSGEVHCWCAGLDVPPEATRRLEATLLAEECDRAERYRYPGGRQRFIVAHGALRDLLGRYLQIQPDRIRYVYDAFGKPCLGAEFGTRLRFNLSHSGDLALIAVTADSSVGVDLECIRTREDYSEVARRFFSGDEVEQLNAMPTHLYAEAFLGCWTRKEACLKAIGRGLTLPLDSFAVPGAAGPTQVPVDVCIAPDDIAPPTRLSVYTLRPAPDYIGALAIEGSGWRLSQHQWELSRD